MTEPALSGMKIVSLLETSLDQARDYAANPEMIRRLKGRLESISMLEPDELKALRVPLYASGIDFDALDKALGIEEEEETPAFEKKTKKPQILPPPGKQILDKEEIDMLLAPALPMDRTHKPADLEEAIAFLAALPEETGTGVAEALAHYEELANKKVETAEGATLSSEDMLKALRELKAKNVSDLLFEKDGEGNVDYATLEIDVEDRLAQIEAAEDMLSQAVINGGDVSAYEKDPRVTKIRQSFDGEIQALASGLQGIVSLEEPETEAPLETIEDALGFLAGQYEKRMEIEKRGETKNISQALRHIESVMDGKTPRADDFPSDGLKIFERLRKLADQNVIDLGFDGENPDYPALVENVAAIEAQYRKAYELYLSINADAETRGKHINDARHVVIAQNYMPYINDTGEAMMTRQRTAHLPVSDLSAAIQTMGELAEARHAADATREGGGILALLSSLNGASEIETEADARKHDLYETMRALYDMGVREIDAPRDENGGIDEKALLKEARRKATAVVDAYRKIFKIHEDPGLKKEYGVDPRVKNIPESHLIAALKLMAVENESPSRFGDAMQQFFDHSVYLREMTPEQPKSLWRSVSSGFGAAVKQVCERVSRSVLCDIRNLFKKQVEIPDSEIQIERDVRMTKRQARRGAEKNLSL